MKHVAGHVTISEQLLPREPRETLHEYTNRGRLFDVEPTFADCVSYEMRQGLYGVADDLRRVYFDGTPQPAQQRLDIITPRCTADTDVGDDACGLMCHRDAGHDGPHYDARLRLEWSQR